MNLIICNHSLRHLSNMADNNNVLGNHDSTQEEMMNEMCLLVNKMDEVIGTKSKLDCHYGTGDRHRAFSVVLFDESGKMIVQQRSNDKITFPSVWANTCCSHPLDMISENTQDSQGVINAAIRKMEHELGIPSEVTKQWNFNLVGKFEYSCRWDDEWIEREIDHVLVVQANTDVDINRNEIERVLWLDESEITEMMLGTGKWENEIIAPWFRMIWEHYLKPNYSNIQMILDLKSNKIIDCGELVISSNNVVNISLKEALMVHKKKVEDEIMESLSKMEQVRLHGAMTHLFSGGGKRYRAILPRLVGEAVGNANKGHYTLGASIEIIHNFTLIHDDIIDQDPIRRGLDAVHVAYDDATAINAGDAMLAVGFEILAESKDISGKKLRYLVTAIGEMVRRVAEGQQEDIEFEDREIVTEDDYIAMIAGKTSAMFETCARTGAILSDASTEIVKNMAKWGLNLGLCFQLMDDLIDITGDTKTLGKPAGSDIVQGKMTLIAIHAKDSGLELPNFNKVFGKLKCDDLSLKLAVEDLQNSGSIEYARNKAMYHHEIAHDCLNKLDQNPQVDVLRELTDLQLTRIN